MIRTIMDHITSLLHVSSPLLHSVLPFTPLHLLCLSIVYSQYYLSVECHENLLAYLSLLDYAGDLKCILDWRGHVNSTSRHVISHQEQDMLCS